MKKYTFLISLLIGAYFGHAQEKQLINWTFAANDKIFAHPCVDGNTLYVGSIDSNFYALDMLSGKPAWRFRTNNGIYSKALVNHHTVYFKSGNDVFALNKQTGDEIWSSIRNDNRGTGQIDFWDYHSGAPAIYKELIYFGLANGTLLGFDQNSGKVIREIINPDSSAIKSSILIENSVLYFGTWKGNVYAYNLETEEKEWGYPTYTEQPYATFGMVNTQFSFNNNLLYFGARNPELQIVDVASGTPKWTYIEKEGGWISGDPLVENDTMYIGGSDNHEMFAFNALTGEKYWAFAFLNNNFSQPLIVSDYLIFTTVDAYSVYGTSKGRGFLYAISKKDGHIKNFARIGGNTHSSPLVKDGMLFLSNEDGNLYVIDLEVFLNDESNLKNKGYQAVELTALSPKPFADILDITYQVNYTSEIIIRVRDLNEEDIRILYSGEKEAGTHRISWDGKDREGHAAAEGYYFVEISSGIYYKKTFIQKKNAASGSNKDQ